MTDYLYNGVYYLLFVAYDAKKGNHYLLKRVENGEIILFHDTHKTMRYCPILDKARLEKKKIKDQIYLKISYQGKTHHYQFNFNRRLFEKTKDE